MSFIHFVGIYLVVFLTTVPVWAANETIDAQIEAQKKKNELLELEAKQAEHEKNISTWNKEKENAEYENKKLGIPEGKSEPKKGTVTMGDKSGFLAEIVAYKTGLESAEQIAKEIKEHSSFAGVSKLLIVNDMNLAANSFPYYQLGETLEKLKTNISNQIEKNIEVNGVLQSSEKSLAGAGLVVTAVAGFVSSAADIIGYFKSDFVMKGRETTVDYLAIASKVSTDIGLDKCYLLDYSFVEKSTILDGYRETIVLSQDLYKGKEELKVLLERYKKAKEPSLAENKKKIAELEKKIKKLESDGGGSGEIRKLKKQIDLLISNKISPIEMAIVKAELAITNSESRLKTFDEYRKEVTQAAKSSPAIILKAVIWERINSLGISHVLFLKILAQGGESIAVEEFWDDGNTIFIGGTVVNYYLFEKTDGRIVLTNTVIKASDFNYDINEDEIPEYRSILSLP